MILDLNKSYIMRKIQTEDSVSFRICFGSGKDWIGMDFKVNKSEFKELSKLDKVMTGVIGSIGSLVINKSVFNLDRAKIGWKSISQESPVEGETK